LHSWAWRSMDNNLRLKVVAIASRVTR